MKLLKSVTLSLLLGLTLNLTYAQIDSTEIKELQERINQLDYKVEKEKSGTSTFLMTGFTNLTYHQDLNDPEISKFAHAGFSPVFIFKPAKKIFFEAELHIEMEGGVHGGEVGGGGHGHGGSDDEEAGHAGSTLFDLGYANMVYFLRPNVIFTAGKFLTPIGQFNERFHPTWINPLPINPLGMGHGGPLPAAELGIQVRGGLQAGKSKVTYVLYVSNGPILDEGKLNSGNAGKLVYSNFSDNNSNKAIGGRFSYLPFHNSSLELGLSGQYAGKTGDRGSRFEDVSAYIYAFDLNFIKSLSSLALLRVNGQYATVNVGDVDYQNTLDDILNGEPVLYTFENTSTYYYMSASLRPVQSSKTFIRNSEITFRYEAGSTPEGSKWHVKEERFLVGYTYWLHARTALKIATAFGESNVLYAQFAIGF